MHPGGRHHAGRIQRAAIALARAGIQSCMLDPDFRFWRFTYNVDKNRLNQTRHGLHLGEAAQVVGTEPSSTREDDRYAYGERRYITTGYLRGDLVIICHTEDEAENLIHVISMRYADSREEKAFLASRGRAGRSPSPD